MARAKALSFAAAALDADGICTSQTPVAGGSQNLTIDGALATAGVATMDIPRHVSITSAADDSARTFIITGTDRYGAALTETITGPATTVNGTKNFATVTVVNVDDDTAGAITVGSAEEFETAWQPWDVVDNTNITHRVEVANGTYGMEHTIDNLQAAGFQDADADTIADGTMSGETTTTTLNVTTVYAGSRLAVTSITGACTLEWKYLEQRV